MNLKPPAQIELVESAADLAPDGSLDDQSEIRALDRPKIYCRLELSTDVGAWPPQIGTISPRL